MADVPRNRNSSSTPQPSRLQMRRPASLQISPLSSSSWNAVIPLLSPLITSPTAIDMKPREEKPLPQSQSQSQQLRNHLVTEADKSVAFKKWQHPAAPFCYETASSSSFAPKFYVPV